MYPFARGSQVSGLAYLLLLMLTLATRGHAEIAALRYDYGNAAPEALQAYREGWREILRNGRWTEAELLYRRAVAIDPGFVIAKSVLARISPSLEERETLLAEVRAGFDAVDPDGQLILAVYADTLELINARENDAALPAGFREDLARRAVTNYRAFIDQYPGEWAVHIEYVEWLHALEGPERALEEVARANDLSIRGSSFSYFPAYFAAELGDLGSAERLAANFVSTLELDEPPQAHYINAYIHYQSGEYQLAKERVSRALQLDPRHLIAQRLDADIDAALQKADAVREGEPSALQASGGARGPHTQNK